MVKAIMIEAGSQIVPPRIEYLDEELTTYQGIVGGLIDVIPAHGILFVFNEEGRLTSEPFNPLATAYLHHVAPK